MVGLVGFLIQLADGTAFLVLASLGLAVIFGMMGVINLAHGELITMGAYTTVVASRAGLPLPGAILAAMAVTAFAGMLIERLIVRRLYGRLFDSIIATWGVSLVLTQGMLVLAGPTMPSIGTPLGSVAVGGGSFAAYRLVLIFVAVCLLALAWWLFNRTRFGTYARAAIQRPDIARALGLDVGKVYAATFGVGAALAGLAGGLYAPTMAVVPTMGTGFVVQAFVTVVVGGADVLAGVAPAALALGLVQTGLTARFGTLSGQIGLLLSAILVIRVLPRGLTGWVRRA